MSKLFYLFVVFFGTNASILWSQEHNHLKGSHRLSLGLGHTHVSEGRVDGETKWLALPSWSFNYDYWVSNKWAVGLQNDLVLESFIIEHSGEEILERSYPVAIVPVAIYKPSEKLSIIGGIGTEFAHQKNLMLTRVGFEYGWHLPGNWEVGGALVWDSKWNYYNSWGLAITVSKIWSKKENK